MTSEDYQRKCIIEYLHNLGGILENDFIQASNNLFHCPNFVSNDKYVLLIEINSKIELYKKVSREIGEIMRFNSFQNNYSFL